MYIWVIWNDKGLIQRHDYSSKEGESMMQVYVVYEDISVYSGFY